MSQESAQAVRPGQDHEWDCSSLSALAGSLEAEAVALESALPALTGRAWMVLAWRASALRQCARETRSLAAKPPGQERWLVELLTKAAPDLLHLGQLVGELWNEDHKLAAITIKFAVDMEFKPAVWRAIAADRASARSAQQTE